MIFKWNHAMGFFSVIVSAEVFSHAWKKNHNQKKTFLPWFSCVNIFSKDAGKQD